MRALQVLFAYAVAVIVAVVAAGVMHMQVVLAELSRTGVSIGLTDRAASTAVAVRGFLPTLGPVLALGLAIAFGCAAVLKRAPLLRRLAPAAYPLAGAAAMAVAVMLMNLEYETTPLASTRTPVGFAAMCAAVGAAGWIFAELARLPPPGWLKAQLERDLIELRFWMRLAWRVVTDGGRRPLASQP